MLLGGQVQQVNAEDGQHGDPGNQAKEKAVILHLAHRLSGAGIGAGLDVLGVLIAGLFEVGVHLSAQLHPQALCRRREILGEGGRRALRRARHRFGCFRGDHSAHRHGAVFVVVEQPQAAVLPDNAAEGEGLFHGLPILQGNFQLDALSHFGGIAQGIQHLGFHGDFVFRLGPLAIVQGQTAQLNHCIIQGAEARSHVCGADDAVIVHPAQCFNQAGLLLSGQKVPVFFLAVDDGVIPVAVDDAAQVVTGLGDAAGHRQGHNQKAEGDQQHQKHQDAAALFAAYPFPGEGNKLMAHTVSSFQNHSLYPDV